MAGDITPVETPYFAMHLTRPLLRNITTRLETDLEGSSKSVGERAILEMLMAVQMAT